MSDDTLRITLFEPKLKGREVAEVNAVDMDTDNPAIDFIFADGAKFKVRAYVTESGKAGLKISMERR